jgi:exopolysaccharide biosynthesis operon protein EpsL
MPVCRFLRLIVLALTLGGTAAAWAEGADDLHFTASLGQVHDSNLFRLPSNIDTVPLIGRSSSAETINITALGANYQRSYSLQRVELDVRVTDYRYQNFDYLSFMATNYRAAWNWSYTPHFYGLLRTTRDESLNSFVDFRGLNQRNLRSDTATNFDATYELDARWRLKGALSRSARSNSEPLTGEADYRSLALQAGAQYVLPSGSSAGYRIRATNGTYTTRRTIPSAGFFDTEFTQTDNILNATWAVSRDTQAEFTFGLRSRSHPNYPQRDFNNVIGSATVNWAYSGKTGLTAGWTREAGAFETADFNFSQTDRFSIGPVWQISPKTTVRLRLEHAIREFKGAPAGFVTAQRRDTTNDASVSVDWEPYRFLLLSASLQNSRRSSTAPGFGFKSNVLNVNAQFTY